MGFKQRYDVKKSLAVRLGQRLHNETVPNAVVNLLHTK